MTRAWIARISMAMGTLMGLVLASSPVPAAAQGISLLLGTQAPDATLETLEGESVQLLDYVEEGKLTLIEFWASWCENCQALQPQLDQIHQDFGPRVNIVAVAVAVAQTQRRVRRHVEEHGVGYPYLWDGQGEAVRAYDVPGTSVVVILDKEGRVAYTGTGRSQDLVGTVTKLLGT